MFNICCPGYSLFYGGTAVSMTINPLWIEVKIKVGVVAERIGHCSRREVFVFVILSMYHFR